MKFLDVFSGIGGFHLGLTRTGHECVGWCEINNDARSVYEKQFPGLKNWKDAQTIDTGQLPDFELLTGGFPCQAFSIAGKQKGFQDTRGTLFFELARFAKACRPKYLLFENVPGLLSHNDGQTFEVILQELAAIGYNVEWTCINSKDYLPQNRLRLYIVGHLGEDSLGKIFHLGRGNKKDHRARQTKKARTIKVIRENYLSNCAHFDDGLLSTLSANHDCPKVIDKKRMPNMPMGNNYDSKYIHDSDNIMSCLTAHHDSPKVIEPNNHSVTFENLEGKLKHRRIRRLTPIECERVQGFPDNWTQKNTNGDVISDNTRYRLCGNAVSVPVIEHIGQRLAELET